MADNPPAFPNTGNSTWSLEPAGGMTLRDWFAGQWLAGYCATQSDALWTSDSYAAVAKGAYAAADAMLAHRVQS